MYEAMKRAFNYYVDKMQNGEFDEIDSIHFKEDCKKLKEITDNCSALYEDYKEFYFKNLI